MKTKTDIVNTRRAIQWLLAVLLVLVFVMVYAWLLYFAVDYPQAGNIGLGVLTAFGVCLAHYLFGLMDQNPAWRAWMSTAMVLTYTMLVLFALVHLAVAVVLHGAGVLIFAAFMPVSLLGGAVFLLIIWALMRGAKENRKSQL